MNLQKLIAGSTKTKLVGGVLGLAAAGAVSLGVAHHQVAAQTTTATPSPSVAAKATATPNAAASGAKGAKGEAAQGFLSRLAAQLHVSTDQLKSAIVAAEKEAVQARVASGALTQAQADKLLAEIDKGGPAVLPRLLAAHHDRKGAGGARGAGARGGREIGEHVLAVVAKQTGLTPKQVMEELRGGRSLAQIGQEKGISQAQLAAAITADVKQRLDAEVAAGKITADQERKLLGEATKHLDTLLTRQPKAGKK